MKVPPFTHADSESRPLTSPASPTLCSHRSFDCLTRDRPASAGGGRKSLSHALLDPGGRSSPCDPPSGRRTSRLPSQQHEPDSWLAGASAQERVALRIRCVYCGAILGCVLGLALLVGAGLSFAIYLGCLSVEQQRAAWLRTLRGPGLASGPTSGPASSPPTSGPITGASNFRLAGLQRLLAEQTEQQQQQAELIRLQFRTGAALAGLGLAALVFGVICCCVHPAATEGCRRTCADCLPRPQPLKLPSGGGTSSPKARLSGGKGAGPGTARSERSVSTCSQASPQHLLAVLGRGGAAHDDPRMGTPSRGAFLRRFSFL